MPSPFSRSVPGDLALVWAQFQRGRDSQSHESDVIGVDSIRGQLQILGALGRFKKIRFPKGPVIPRPRMTTEWKAVLVDFKAVSRGRLQMRNAVLPQTEPP